VSMRTSTRLRTPERGGSNGSEHGEENLQPARVVLHTFEQRNSASAFALAVLFLATGRSRRGGEGLSPAGAGSRLSSHWNHCRNQRSGAIIPHIAPDAISWATGRFRGGVVEARTALCRGTFRTAGVGSAGALIFPNSRPCLWHPCKRMRLLRALSSHWSLMHYL
jgi:hypothetical protein